MFANSLNTMRFSSHFMFEIFYFVATSGSTYAIFIMYNILHKLFCLPCKGCSFINFCYTKYSYEFYIMDSVVFQETFTNLPYSLRIIQPQKYTKKLTN